MAEFVETLWTTDMFNGTEIPPVLHMKQWSEDLGLMMDTMMNSNDIEFKV